MGGLKEIFFDYALWTSAHGIPHVARVHTNKARVFWLSVFLASVCVMSWEISNIIQRYFQYEKTTGLRLEVENQEFPSVTVCSLNPYRQSMALGVSGIKDLLEAFAQSTGVEKQAEGIEERSKRAIEAQTWPCACDSKGEECFVVDVPDSFVHRICACSTEGELCQLCSSSNIDDCLSRWGSRESLSKCLCDAEGKNCRIDTHQPYAPNALNCMCNRVTGACRLLDSVAATDVMRPCICVEGAGCVQDLDPNSDTHFICMCNQLSKYCRRCPDQDCTDLRIEVSPCTCTESGMCSALPEMQIGEEYALCYCRIQGNDHCSPCTDPNCLQKYSVGWTDQPSYIRTTTSATTTTATGGSTDRSLTISTSQGTESPIPILVQPSACLCIDGTCTSTVVTMENAEQLEACICDRRYHICIRCSQAECLKHFAKLLRSTSPAPTTTNYKTTPAPRLTTGIPQLDQTTEVPSFGFANEAKDQIANQAKAEKGLIYVAASLNETVRKMIGYQLKDFIIQCAFNTKSCDIENDFTQFQDPNYGNCYSFNKSVKSDHAGPVYGLQLILFADNTEYLATSKMAGVRLVVHDRFARPFPDSTGYNAPTGAAVSFGLRKKQNQRLPKPYGDCVVSSQEVDAYFYTGNYTVEGCFRSCLQRELVNQCDCADPQYPREHDEISFCQSPSEIMCLQQKSNYLQQSCKCPLPCEEVQYDVTISSAAWPLESSQISGCKEEENLARFNRSCSQTYKEMAVMVQVYFEQLNQEVVYESPAFPGGALLADIASQVGFWVGVSVLSMVELLVLFSKVVMFCFIQEKREKTPGRPSHDWRSRLMSIFGQVREEYNHEIVTTSPPDPEQGKASFRRLSSLSHSTTPGGLNTSKVGSLPSPTLSPTPEEAPVRGSMEDLRGRRGRPL